MSEQAPPSTAIAPVSAPAPKLSLIASLAARYQMEPRAFADTVRATVFPNGRATNEQLAAFMAVAHEYQLNPFLKQIYAFPSQGGGVIPIVSVDGWCAVINARTELDGIEFTDSLADGKLASITCRIWRKDRSRPVEVTEYMAECLRSTDPWKKWPVRMLRHKALIQCARYAFALTGIYDEDEAERIAAAQPVDTVYRDAAQAGRSRAEVDAAVAAAPEAEREQVRADMGKTRQMEGFDDPPQRNATRNAAGPGEAFE